MQAPNITKGRLTERETGRYREFSLNPAEISDSAGANYGKHTIPGMSAAAKQFGSGKDRTISFTLRLDGDIGKREIRATLPNGINQDVSEELLWYRQFVYGRPNARSQTGLAPAVLLFSFGRMYQGVPVVMTQCDARIVEWTKTLDPKRVDLALTFEEVLLRDVGASDIYNVSRGSF